MTFSASEGWRGAPQTAAEFAAMMAFHGSSNETLLQYVYPRQLQPLVNTEMLRTHWTPYTEGCDVKHDCYCYHVQGDMSASRNPMSAGGVLCEISAGGGRVAGKCAAHTKRQKPDCSCLSQRPNGPPCLFSDMRPMKIHSAIAAARIAGVDHIVEEGRFGGLSAYMYSLHGFAVTSIEYLPLSGPSEGLAKLAPAVRQLTGDGSVLIPQLVRNMSAHEAARTMVIFDGEKRMGAWPTFTKVRDAVGLAIFDDINVGRGHAAFTSMLSATGQIWWQTADPSFDRLFGAREQRTMRPLLAPLKTAAGDRKWHGNVHLLERFHFAIVVGGGWRSKGHANWCSGAFAPEAAGSAASRWCPGYCAHTSADASRATPLADLGCTASLTAETPYVQGSWPLSEAQSTSPQAAMRACKRMCQRCANCRVVSASHTWRECSWYTACSAELRTDVAGYLTMAVRF